MKNKGLIIIGIILLGIIVYYLWNYFRKKELVKKIIGECGKTESYPHGSYVNSNPVCVEEITSYDTLMKYPYSSLQTLYGQITE